MDDVPEMIFRSGGDRGAQCFVGVGADEGQAAEDDPQLAGLHVVLDERRHRVPRPLRAVGALQVGVLDERHRRLRRAESRAMLLDPGEERRLGLDRCSRCVRGGCGGRRLGVAGADLAGADQDGGEGGGSAQDDRKREAVGCEVCSSQSVLEATKTQEPTRRRLLRFELSVGHRPLGVADLEQADLAEIDVREGVGDERIEALLVDLDVEDTRRLRQARPPSARSSAAGSSGRR